MKVNIRRIIFNIVVMAMVVCIAYIGMSKVGNFSKENLWSNQGEINNESMDSKVTDKETDREEYEREESPIRLYDMGEEITFGPYTYKVNSATYGKERGDFYAPIHYESYTYDENGDLVGDSSYVVINITIVNNEEKTLELYLNTVKLIVLRDPETRVGDYSECVSASKLEGYGRKDFFCVELEPGIEYNYDLVFISPDASLNNNEGQLRIQRQGIFQPSDYNDDARYVDIKFR